MRVPRSQRGGEIVEPLVREQWFVRMEPLAKPALEVSALLHSIEGQFQPFRGAVRDVHKAAGHTLAAAVHHCCSLLFVPPPVAHCRSFAANSLLHVGGGQRRHPHPS